MEIKHSLNKTWTKDLKQVTIIPTFGFNLTSDSTITFYFDWLMFDYNITIWFIQK